MNKNTTKAAVWYLIQDYNTLIIRDFCWAGLYVPSVIRKFQDWLKLGFMAEYWCKLASAAVLNGRLRMFQYKSVLIVIGMNSTTQTSEEWGASTWLCSSPDALLWGLETVDLSAKKNTLCVQVSAQDRLKWSASIICRYAFFGWNRIECLLCGSVRPGLKSQVYNHK